MATVNGYTAERIQEIENQAIVGGAVVNDDLILTRFNGQTINAGNVKGDPGPQDLTDLLNLADPVGTVKPYEHNVLPTGHGWCDAQTEYDGATYPTLASIFTTGPGCVNGPCAPGNFRLPDHRGKFLVSKHSGITAFDTLRETGGNKDSIVVTHGHPGSTSDQAGHAHTADQGPHGHGVGVQGGNADHTHGTGDGGTHSHGVNGDSWESDRIVITFAGSSILMTTGAGQEVTYSHLDPAGNHNHGATGGATGAANHGHGVNQSDADPAISVSTEDPAITTTIASSGVSGTDTNLPPYRVVNTIMRLA